MEDYKLVSYKTEPLAKPHPNVDVMGDGIIEQIMNEIGHRKVGPGYTGQWTVREKQDGVWTPVKRRKNLLTNFGLTALVSAYSGTFLNPNYLIYDAFLSNMTATSLGGDSVIYVTNSPLLSGDNALTLSVGLAAQEQVTISGSASVVIGGIPCLQCTLSTPTTYSHAAGDPVTRAPTLTDTLASIPLEQAFDPANFSGQRAASTAGYTGGIGNFILQFYLLTTQANGSNGGSWFGNVGTADTITMATGNVHNLYSLGYSHTSANDVEIDVVITIANS